MGVDNIRKRICYYDSMPHGIETKYKKYSDAMNYLI